MTKSGPTFLMVGLIWLNVLLQDKKTPPFLPGFIPCKSGTSSGHSGSSSLLWAILSTVRMTRFSDFLVNICTGTPIQTTIYQKLLCWSQKFKLYSKFQPLLHINSSIVLIKAKKRCRPFFQVVLPPLTFFLLFFFLFSWARHNGIASCGMIEVLLNWYTFF